MPLRIIYGRAGTGKSEYCFSEIAKIIEKEKKIYVITPEQFSFNAEKKLMEKLEKKAVLNAEVLTFSRMAYRVLSETGGIINKSLTKCGKAMLIYSILNDNKNNLKYLNKSDENVDLLITTITEFKKHGVTVDLLKSEIEKTSDDYLKSKLKDVLVIYESFENKIKDNYIDETDLLTMLFDKLDETDIIKDSIIFIDEFSGFTYQEYNLIKKFIELAKQVNITICSDSLLTSKCPDTDIFYTNKITISKLLKIVEDNNFQLENPIFLNEPKRFKTEELIILEQNLYNNKITNYKKEPLNIKLFLSNNQYSEIENVAKNIRKLVRDEGIRYKDISIITKNIETYSNLVRAIFKSYEIPVFIDEKRSLNQNIIVQYVLAILDILAQNYSLESVFNYLKLGFLDIDMDDIFKLENYCTKWGIKHNKWKSDFKYGKHDENSKDEVEYLNDLRKSIINPIIELKQKCGNAKETTIALYQFLEEQKLIDKINIKEKELEDCGFIDLANEYKESYKIILDILDEIVLIFENETITISKYLQILKIGIKNSGLGKIPGTQDQVIFGDIDRSRSHKVDSIFIIGLNDGVFSNVKKYEGFFGDKDRESLKNDGIELAKGTIENLYEDNFNIYKAFATAERKLFLSYSSSEIEGKTLRPSVVINKVKRIFPNLQEKSDIIKKDYEIINEEVTYEELLENIFNLKEDGSIDEKWFQVYNYYNSKPYWKEKLQKDLKGIDYTNIPKNIDKEIIQKLYGNTLNTSVSRLEKYAQCPFSYYLQYGLKLKEKEELKVKSLDTGSFMHNVIDLFFKKTREEKIGLPSLLVDTNKIVEIVENIIDEIMEQEKSFTFVATAKYKVLLRRLKRIVSKALKYIIEGLVYSEFEIEGTEVEFGRNAEYNPIQIEMLESGKRVEITGKIDRIDTAKVEDGKYLRIIDYKSSAKNIDLNEVYAGLQIQLLTYLDAVCKQKDLMPTGVLYFNLLEQMVKADNKITEEQIEEEIRKSFKMKGLIVADIKIIKMHDKNLKTGASKLVPATLTTSGEIYRNRTNGVTQEEFKVLQEFIFKTIKQISEEILSGNISIKPYNKNGKVPCDYCSYKAICGFDTRICGNKYNYIDSLTGDEVIEKMRK